MRYARIDGTVVAEILELHSDVSPADAFHPSIAGMLVVCDPEVTEGWSYDGETFRAPEHSVVDLEAVKSTCKAMIDAAAETERLKYITAGAGQAMTYQQKIEEVRALAQDAEPEAANYPLLSAEIGITAPTLADVASAVLAAYQQWQVIGAAIERARLAGKAAVAASETAEAAMDVSTSVVWPAR